MATSRSPGSQVVCFEVYEADLRSGELRKQGLRVRLSEQPFQVLAVLLEHPGEVVTRESLQKRLWSHGTFVDFEQGLNAAVKAVGGGIGRSGQASPTNRDPAAPRVSLYWVAGCQARTHRVAGCA